jgi:hypothetical protein
MVSVCAAGDAVVPVGRGMNVFHRVKPEALQALCVVLDPNDCT